MRKIHFKSWAAIVLAALLLSACAAIPQSPNQAIYAAQKSLTVAVNAFADVRDAELKRREVAPNERQLLSDEDYGAGKRIAFEAAAALKNARVYVSSGDGSGAIAAVGVVNDLIMRLAIYNGGKR